MTKQNPIKYFIGPFLFTALWIFLDQWTKHAARITLSKKITLNPFISLSGVWNPGISFGLFPCHSFTEKTILSTISLGLVFFLIHQYKHMNQRAPSIGILLMISGACGNLWDRIYHGKVFDFIAINFGTWVFPVFNLADMLITIGFFLLIINTLGTHMTKEPTNTKKNLS